MAVTLKTLDVSDSPELGRLVEEVSRTGEARILRFHDEDLAVILPFAGRSIRRKRRSISSEDVEAFRAAAGTWAAVDVDRFLEENARSRRHSSRLRIQKLPV
jgi:hypothetical protein